MIWERIDDDCFRSLCRKTDFQKNINNMKAKFADIQEAFGKQREKETNLQQLINESEVSDLL